MTILFNPKRVLDTICRNGPGLSTSLASSLHDRDKNEEARMERARAATYLLLRVIPALLFMQYGGMGLFGWFGGVPPGGGPAPLMSQAWIGAVLQFFGGLLVAIGLFTRPAAFVISGEMAVAYFQFHQPNALFPIQNEG